MSRTDELPHLDALCERALEPAVALRRELHRHPELSWNEHRTQKTLSARLVDLGLEPRPVAGTGLVCDVGQGEVPVVYRADMDALPLQDAKDPATSPVTSQVDGISHACGHDLHCAVAVGLADALSRIALPGRVRFVFQPAEEMIPSGAEAVVREGVVDGARACFALHVDPMRATGRIGVRHGPMTAAGDAFHLDIAGKSGHASRPYLSKNPIVAAARVVDALGALVGQQVNPIEPAVVSVASIHGGSASNVIPARVKISGTVRTFTEPTREALHQAIAAVARDAAATVGCTVEPTFDLGAPSLVNDAGLDRLVRAVAGPLLGEDAVEEIAWPSTGSEDFSYFGTRAPTYMLRLGVRHPERTEPTHLHSADFEPDEDALAVALKVMGRTLVAALS